jgi:hypothetical protein
MLKKELKDPRWDLLKLNTNRKSMELNTNIKFLPNMVLNSIFGRKISKYTGALANSADE